MRPNVTRNSDGSMTVTFTIPAASKTRSLLRVEERITSALNEAGRESMRHVLSEFDVAGSPIMRDSRQWTTKGLVDKIYETPWGEVMLARHLYQSSAGGKTWCPMEENAGIIGGSATPHLARSLSHKYANKNARAVVRDLEENHGRKLAASYVSDIAAAVAKMAGSPVVEQRAFIPESKPDDVFTATLSLDGTCALFCKEGFKQCMVGTIGLYDSEGDRLETIYLAQAPEMGKEIFLSKLDAEWQRIVKRFPIAKRVGISDGARDYEPWLRERTTWQVLDFYHATGYLAAAALKMRRSKTERTEWLERTCHELKHDLGGAERITNELIKQEEADGSKQISGKRALQAAVGYFQHNIERMDYARFAELNFPIGSGVTEAACKVLVKERLCGSGMRWTRSGAQTVLTIRSILLSSNRWQSLWKFFDKNRI